MSAIQQTIASFGASRPNQYRFWRLYITANGGDVGYQSASEVQLRETPGVAANMPAIASSSDRGFLSAAYGIDKLYDGIISDTSNWICAAGDVSFPQGLNFDLGYPRTVRELAIAPQPTVPLRAPKTFSLLGSNVDLNGPYELVGIYSTATYSSAPNPPFTTFPVPYGV